MISDLELSLTIISVSCLAVNAYFDLKTRYASDKVWAVQILASLTLLIAYSVFVGFSYIYSLIIVINIILGIIIGIGTLLLRIWGGGDSKGLIALSVSSPFVFSFIPNISSKYLTFPTVLFLLTNLIIGMSGYVVYMLLVNLKNRLRYGNWFGETSGSTLNKMQLLITSIQIPVEQITENMFYDPVEELQEEQWKIHVKMLMEDLDDEELEELERENRLRTRDDAEKTGRTYIWCRYQVPGLVPFLIGYIYWLVLGSPLTFYLDFLTR